jgi:hypothetical protein
MRISKAFIFSRATLLSRAAKLTSKVFYILSGSPDFLLGSLIPVRLSNLLPTLFGLISALWMYESNVLTKIFLLRKVSPNMACNMVTNLRIDSLEEQRDRMDIEPMEILLDGTTNMNSDCHSS